MNARPRNLDAKTCVLVALSVGLSVAAQLLLRYGMSALSHLGGLDLYRGALTSWPVLLGILAYGVGTVAWLIVLSRLDLAVAYPLGATNYVLVTLLAATLLGETVSWIRWAGTALILLGVLVIAVGERPRQRESA